MVRRSRVAVGSLFVGFALLSFGCGDDDDDEPTELPNPASAFCEEQGGQVEIVDEEGGQVGYCVLPDGTRVEEWEYFRENAPD